MISRNVQKVLRMSDEEADSFGMKIGNPNGNPNESCTVERAYASKEHGCPYLNNFCEDMTTGMAYVKTDDPHYIDYIPRGWTRRNGWYDRGSNTVNMTSIPIYDTLEWTPCANGNDTCESRSMTKLWTGIRSDFRGEYGIYYGDNDKKYTLTEDLNNTSGYSCNDGTPCPGSDNKNLGKTPCAQQRCKACLYVRKLCMESNGTRSCPSNSYQYLCAKDFDVESTCPRIGKVTPTEAVQSVQDAAGKGYGDRIQVVTTKQSGFDNGINYGSAVCSYASNAIQSEGDLLDYLDKVERNELPGNISFKAPLMRNFCTRFVDNTNGGKCIANAGIKGDSETEREPPGCSYYMASSRAGEECRKFLDEMYALSENNTPNLPFTYDNIITDHCNKYSGLYECRCRNRGSDEVYQTLVREYDSTTPNPSCWYFWCMNGMEQGVLLDSEVKKVKDDPAACKTINCTNIYRIINSHYNNIVADQAVDCDVSFEGDDTSGSTTSTPVTTNPPSGPGGVFAGGDSKATTSKENTDFFSTITDSPVFLGIITVVGVLVIGGGIFVALNKKGGEKKGKGATKEDNETPFMTNLPGPLGHLFSEDKPKKRKK